MTNYELQALRRLLFFSRHEAAMWVPAGGVQDRTWQRWEAGDRAIPADVIASMLELVRWRQEAIDTATAAGDPALVWYDNVAEWVGPNRPARLWRPHQSVCAALAAGGRRLRQ